MNIYKYCIEFNNDKPPVELEIQSLTKFSGEFAINEIFNNVKSIKVLEINGTTVN